MNSIADIALVIPIILSTYVAFKKGFFRTLFSLMSGFLSIILSFVFQPFVNTILKNSFIENSIKTTIKDAMPEIQNSIMPADFINTLEFPQFIKDILIQNLNDNVIKNTGVQIYVTDYISEICMQILSFIITFLIISSVLYVIRKLIYLIRKLPLLRQFDNIAGALLGFLRGILISFIIAVIAIFFQTYDSSGFLKETIENSIIINKVSESGIFESIIKNIDFLQDNEKEYNKL